MTTPANASAAYKNQIRDIVLGSKTLTVGEGGEYNTVAEAVAFINTQPRYTVVYDIGTATLTAQTKTMTPSDGADWTGLGDPSAQEYWLYLDTAGVMIPLQGVAPPLGTDAPTTVWGDYGELKFDYIGVTGAKSYQIVTPNWYHILLLAGETVDPVNINWPEFTTLSGLSQESCMFRGSISLEVGSAGIWVSNLAWVSINNVYALPTHAQEESFITVIDELATEEGYAQIVTRNIEGGKGKADRDVIYRSGNTPVFSHALFESLDCNYYSHYDAIQCISRNIVFKRNNIYVHTQDTTIYDATGFRWFSTTVAPETDLFVDIDGNEFFIIATDGARAASGLILVEENAAYISARPNIYGRITNNFIQVHQEGSGDARGINGPQNLWGVNTGRLFVDSNTFDVISAGGIQTDLFSPLTNSHLLFGKNNIRNDGSEFSISGAPKRLESHGLSASIATGETIPHGLVAVPTTVSVTPTGAATDVSATVDATNITVTFGGGPSTFHWKVEL